MVLQENELPFCSPDPPLSLLRDPQQLKDQLGGCGEDRLDSTLLQEADGLVGPDRVGQHQRQALEVDLPPAVLGAVGPAAPIELLRRHLAAVLLR